MRFIRRPIVQITLSLLFISTVIPVGYNIISLNKYSGLDDSFRLTLSLIIGFGITAFIMFALYSVSKSKPVATLAFTIFSVVIIVGTTYTGYVNARVYNTLSNMTVQTTVNNYELVSLATQDIETYEDLQGLTIGQIPVENEIISEEINQFLKEHDLLETTTLTTVANTLELISQLYSGEVDAILISEGYEQLLKTQLGYERIEEETRTLAEIEMSHLKVDVTEEKEYVSLTEAPFSVLLMGVDSEKGSITTSSTALADSLILATINPKNLSVTMTSIPRDTYTPITCFNNQSDKITHANNGGIDCVIDSVSELFDVEIPYYAMINFKGFVELIDEIGGIEVDVPYSFSEQNSDREFGDKMIHVEKGRQTLNGEEALALARHRKTLANGDLGRAESQQLVINATVSTLLTKFTSISKFLDVFDVLGDNVSTNFSIEQITSSFEYLLDILSTYGAANPMTYIHIKNMVLSGEFEKIHNPMYGVALDYVNVYEGALNDAKNHIYTNLELSDPKKLTTFTFDPFSQEDDVVWVDSYYEDTYTEEGPIKQTKVPDFVANRWQEDEILEWGWRNQVEIKVNTISVEDPNYDPKQAGLVTYQNVEPTADIIDVYYMTVNVMEKYELPDFNESGATEQEITTWAHTQGALVEFLQPIHSEVEKGSWIVNIEPGALVSADTNITFTQSLGVYVQDPEFCEENETLIDGLCVLSTDIAQ